MNRLRLLVCAVLLCSSASASAQTADEPADGDRPWLTFAGTDRSLIVVPAILNGKPVMALVDSGVSGVAVSKDFAIREGFALTDIGSAYGVGGLQRFYKTPHIQLTIDGIRGPDDAAQVTVFDALRKVSGQPFDVVIGASFIAAFGLQIDFDHRRLRFQPQVAATGTSIPLTYERGRFTIAGASAGRAIAPLIVDLGSNAYLNLSPSTMAGITGGKTPGTDIQYVGAAGNEIDTLTSVPDFTLGAASFGRVTAGTSPEMYSRQMPGIAGSVGLGIIAAYNVSIDVGRSRMILTPRSVPISPEVKSTVGIQGEYEADRILVTHVMRGSPADKAGIRSGEAVCAVNDQPVVDGWKTSPMLHWGTVAPGNAYTIRLCSGRIVRLRTAAFY